MLSKGNIFIFFLLIVYLAFPTNNSTIDAFYYAAQIKYNLELYHPHHLLYNALGLQLYHLFTITTGSSLDVLAFMKALNAFFAMFCLIILKVILKNLKVENNLIAFLLLLTGASFAVVRFSTENETYIVPVAFSLLATLFFIKHLNLNKLYLIFLSGLFASIACLFHQIHFFWWFGLLISILITVKAKRVKNILTFTIPALLVPATYLLVIRYDQAQEITLPNILFFVFREFYLGNTETEFSINHIILTIINSGRTWIQVHGNIYPILNYNPALIPFILVAVVFFYVSIRNISFKNVKINDKKIFYSILVILILQLAFAFYAVGNAEFMVMIPFLAAILLACLSNLSYKAVAFASIGIFIWNFTLGVFPAYRYDLTELTAYRKHIINNPDKIFIVSNKPHVETEIEYYTGKTPKNIVPSPEYCIRKYGNTTIIKDKIDSASKANVPVITDCLGNRSFLNRKAILSQSSGKSFFNKYQIQLSDSVSYTFNSHYLYAVNHK